MLGKLIRHRSCLRLLSKCYRVYSMLSLNVRANVVRLARNLVELTPYHWKHFSFIVRKNNVVSIGWNQPYKTHPLAVKWGYKFGCIHSELHSILKFDNPPAKLYRYSLVNVRLDKHGNVRMSKPCKHCQALLLAFNLGDVWYTNNSGEFVQL